MLMQLSLGTEKSNWISEVITHLELDKDFCIRYELYKSISKQENAHPEAVLLVAGDFNAGKLKSIYLISTTMSHVQSFFYLILYNLYLHTEARTKLSLALHLVNLTIILSSCFLRTSKN